MIRSRRRIEINPAEKAEVETPAIRPIDSVLSPSSPVLSGLSLGDVVRARVLEVTADVTRLSVGGQTILAQTRASLAPGDQIRLQVRDLAPDRVELRLVPPEEDAPAPGPIVARDPSDALASLGVADSAANRAIAAALLAARQPVTGTAIDDIARALARSRLPAEAATSSATGTPGSAVTPDPPPDPADLRAAVFLEAHRLPLSPSAIALARRFLADAASGTTLAGRLQDLGELLDTLSPHPLPPLPREGEGSRARDGAGGGDGDGPLPQPPPPRGEGTTAKDGAGFGGIGRAPSSPLPLGEGQGEGETRVPAADTSEAGNGQATATRLAPTGRPGEGTSGVAGSGVAALRELVAALPLLSETRASAGSAGLATTLRGLVETLGTSLEHRLADAAAGQVPIADLDRDPRALVAQALGIVDRLPGNPALGDLRATLQGLGDHLAGQQLANLGSTGSELDPGYYLVQIPVAGAPGDPYRTAELRIYRSGDDGGSPAGSRVDPESARIVFHLSLSQLQTVDLDLSIHRRQVSCRIASADEATARFIQDRAGGLRDGLFALGYVVGDVRSVPRLPAPPDAGTSGRGDARTGTPPRLLRLDARA